MLLITTHSKKVETKRIAAVYRIYKCTLRSFFKLWLPNSVISTSAMPLICYQNFNPIRQFYNKEKLFFSQCTGSVNYKRESCSHPKRAAWRINQAYFLGDIQKKKKEQKVIQSIGERAAEVKMYRVEHRVHRVHWEQLA